MSSMLQRAGNQSISANAQEESHTTLSQPVKAETTNKQQSENGSRSTKLRKLFRTYNPRFLRNRLANLRLSQDGLKPELISRLVDATLLLERGVAPTTAATQTGEKVELNLGTGADQVQPGQFKNNKDVNAPLRKNKAQDSLQAYHLELESRAKLSADEVIAAERKKYDSRIFQHHIKQTHASIEDDEQRLWAIHAKEETSKQLIRADQERIVKAKIERAEASEVERRRRIKLHGGIDPLQPPKKDRQQLIDAIRDEIKDMTVKELRNALALKGKNDTHKFRLPDGDWETRFLMRDGLLERLHQTLVDDRLGADDDILLNALQAAGFNPSKKVFTKQERQKLQKQLARLNREKLTRQQAEMREQMLSERAIRRAQRELREKKILAARDAEICKVHDAMQDLALQQQRTIRSAIASVHSLRKNHFDSMPNGFPAPNALLPANYVESEVEKYAKNKQRESEKKYEAEAMAKCMPAVNQNAQEDRRRASESHFVSNTKNDFLYGNLIVNESPSKNAHFGIGDKAIRQEPTMYVGPVWRERPEPPPKKYFSRGEVLGMLFWGSYKGALDEVKKAIPLIDWNSGINYRFELGAGIHHPATAHGDTALHLASRRGHSKIVRELINKGANHEIKNKQGMTAFDVARAVDTSRMKFQQRDAYRKILSLLGKMRGNLMKIVRDWLSQLKVSGKTDGLDIYAEKFESCGYDDISKISILNDDGINKLAADVRMNNRGHVNRLKQAVKILNLQMTGQISQAEATAKLEQLSDTRSKNKGKQKLRSSTMFNDDILNGNRELQKIMRRQYIRDRKAITRQDKMGNSIQQEPRVRGGQDVPSRNWRFAAELTSLELEEAKRNAVEAAAKNQTFQEMYPVGYDPPNPKDRYGDGMPTLKWSEKKIMNLRARQGSVF